MAPVRVLWWSNDALLAGCSLRLKAHGRVTAPEGTPGGALTKALQGQSAAMTLQGQALI
jgi:hypothetical protein